MSDNRITINDVHKHTNGGLDVILSLFPDAFGSIAQPNKKFKMRGEKTASAKLNQLKDGTYRVVDFGNSEESLNCVELYMEEMGTTFGRAIQAIAQQYNVKPEVQEVIKSKFSSRPANPEEKEGDQTFEIRDSWTDAEIEYIVSRNVLKEIGWNSKVKGEKEEAYARIAGVFKEYNWYPLISFSTVKDRVVKTSSSTPDYPIFLWDEGQLKKIYQPKNHKKEFRFMYGTGSKVGDFIHGLKQLQEAYIKRTNGNTATINENAENADLRIGVEAKKTEKPEFDQVLLMSGGSDAINAAILGYRVIWGTSETFVLKGWQFGEIMKTTDKLCQLMDLDATGKDVAHKRNMEYINLHTIELPVSLLERQDSRGYQCKDFRDYMNYYSAWEFSLLVKTSMPYRFWDEKMKYDRQERDRKSVV